jgi:hypothetical protein
VAGNESSIGFYRNANRGISVTGDLWLVGHAAHTSGDRGFAIGCNGIGAIMAMQPTGATVFNYGVAAQSMTVGGSAVLTSASSIPIGNVTNLQNSLDGKQASLNVIGSDAGPAFRLVAGTTVKALRSSNYVTLSQTANDVTVSTTTALQTALDGKANTSGASFSGAVTVPSMLDVVPSVAGGRAELTFYRNIDKSGGDAGARWTIGRDSHAVGANNFAIGNNTLGTCMTFSTTGAVSIPGTLAVTGSITSAGLPLYTKPYIAGRISAAGVTGIDVPVPIISGGTAANNAGQQLIASATRIDAGRYRINWTTPHPNGDQFGVYLTPRITGGFAHWGTPTSTSFNMFCSIIVNGVVTPSDPQDIAFMTIP